MGNFAEYPRFYNGQLNRPRAKHGMPIPINMLAINVRYGSKRTQRKLTKEQPNGQWPTGFKANLALFGQASGNGTV